MSEPTPSIHIARWKVIDVAGWDELEVRPGKVCVAQGRNSLNKTNILRALRAALGGGHDAELIRHGAKQGQIVLEFSDGHSLETKIKLTGTERVLKDATGTRLSKPMTRLSEWLETQLLNPIEFLQASKSDRVRLLARAMPLDVSVQQIVEAAAGQELPDPPGRLTGIELVSHAEQSYFDARRGQKQVRDELRKTEANLARSVADAPETDELVQARDTARAKLAELREQREREGTEAKSGSDKALAQVMAQVERELGAIREECGKGIRAKEQEREALRADYDARIRQLERERDAALAERTEAIRAQERERDERLRAIEQAAEEEREAIRAQYQSRQADAAAKLTAPIEEAAAKLAQIDEQIAEAHRLEGVRSQLDETRRKLAAAEERVAALQRAVDGVRALREQLLAKLPIPDLEVKDGEVWYRGARWDLIEESEQIRLAIEIACLLSKDVGVILADGLEALDPHRFQILCDSIQAKGLQLIGTRVSDDAELQFVGNGQS